MAGLIGTYGMLILLLLAGRIPLVERTLGQDRLTRWHRLLAPWALILIAAHGALITAGYAQQARTGLLHEFGVLISTYPGILTATAGFLLLIAAGFTSARIARRHMRDVYAGGPASAALSSPCAGRTSPSPTHLPPASWRPANGDLPRSAGPDTRRSSSDRTAPAHRLLGSRSPTRERRPICGRRR
jgi:hypothetical protein